MARHVLAGPMSRSVFFFFGIFALTAHNSMASSSSAMRRGMVSSDPGVGGHTHQPTPTTQPLWCGERLILGRDVRFRSNEQIVCGGRIAPSSSTRNTDDPRPSLSPLQHTWKECGIRRVSEHGHVDIASHSPCCPARDWSWFLPASFCNRRRDDVNKSTRITNIS